MTYYLVALTVKSSLINREAVKQRSSLNLLVNIVSTQEPTLVTGMHAIGRLVIEER